ncbi:hypothetical protein [Haloferax sp. CBA1149]|uniref:hypothetical protein n=1 Tax=Haloferax sp. CBA1149 TaxID=2650753 RepID=UPI001780531F|nr:hypothetical protein [Haloferax sp. CBA1149]
MARNTNTGLMKLTRPKTCSSPGHGRDKIKRHIQCSDLSIQSVQYLTFTRAIDLVDADMEVMKIATDPDEYAVWKLIEAEMPPEADEEDKTIKYHDGHVENPNLRRLGEDGIDPTLAENDDIRFHLTSHPVFPLGEVLLQLYLNNMGSVDEPKEFRKREFERTFKSKIHLGTNRRNIDRVVDSRIDELLEIALNYGMIKDSDADVVKERDFRIMWESEDPGEIKDMVKDKFFDGMVPEETGKLAYQRAREEFVRKESSLDEFDD